LLRRMMVGDDLKPVAGQASTDRGSDTADPSGHQRNAAMLLPDGSR
jgi:hypothetical protein